MDATAASWLTYGELAARLGIELRSARNLVRRKRWRRTRGNDGLTKVEVPEEALARRPDAPAEGTVEGTAEGTLTPDPVIPALHRHIERLEAELQAQQAEREALRERAEGLAIEAACAPVLRQSLEALKVALESERLFRDELRRELDQARRPWWRRLTRAA